MRYYLHTQHSFHVIHPGLSIEPNFPLHGLTCTENPGMEPTYQANTSYMQHLSTRGRAISNFISLNIDIASGNVWAKLVSRPFTLNMFKQVEQFITSVYKMQYINLGFVFLPLILIALNLKVVIANHRPNIIINFPLFIYLFISFAI